MLSTLLVTLVLLASMLACAPRQAPDTYPMSGQIEYTPGWFNNSPLKALVSNLGVGSVAAANMGYGSEGQ